MTASDPVLNRRLYRICRTAMPPATPESCKQLPSGDSTLCICQRSRWSALNRRNDSSKSRCAALKRVQASWSSGKCGRDILGLRNRPYFASLPPFWYCCAVSKNRIPPSMAADHRLRIVVAETSNGHRKRSTRAVQSRCARLWGSPDSSISIPEPP
jgi:hypothetical protein